MSVLNQSGEEQVECPLCMEPLEVDDLNFFPCTCGYQICRFCWHRIRTDENGLCPACRKAYSENPADFTPLSKEQVAQLKAEKRQRDQQRKAKLSESRKHLANVRVVQKNLVFVVGLPMRLADPEILKRHEYFGKFGKIHKVVINQSTSYAGSQGPSASAYVTYIKSDDALRAIQSVNNITIDGRLVKSSLGTTKYCSHFMKNQSCPKPDCMYLHDFGDPEASFTKEQMHAGKHQEYEKKLHEALLAKIVVQGSQQQGDTGSGKPAKSKDHSTSSSMNNHNNNNNNSNNKEGWPHLNNPQPGDSSTSKGAKTSDKRGDKQGESATNSISNSGKEKGQKSRGKSKNNNNDSSRKDRGKGCESGGCQGQNDRQGRGPGKSRSQERDRHSGRGDENKIKGADKTNNSSREASVGRDSSNSSSSSEKSHTTSESIGVAAKLQIVNENSSFFSQNVFQKLSPAESDHSSSGTGSLGGVVPVDQDVEDEDESNGLLSHNNSRNLLESAGRIPPSSVVNSSTSHILNDSLPNIDSSEDWEAAFGFSKNNNVNENEEKRRKEMLSGPFGNGSNGYISFLGHQQPQTLFGGHDSAAAASTLLQNSFDTTKLHESILDVLNNKNHFFSNSYSKTEDRLGGAGHPLPHLNSHHSVQQHQHPHFAPPNGLNGINGLDQQMSKFFTDFCTKNSQNGLLPNGLSSSSSPSANSNGFVGPQNGPHPHTSNSHHGHNGFLHSLADRHNFLVMQQKQIEEQLLTLKQQQQSYGQQLLQQHNGLAPPPSAPFLSGDVLGGSTTAVTNSGGVFGSMNLYHHHNQQQPPQHNSHHNSSNQHHQIGAGSGGGGGKQQNNSSNRSAEDELDFDPFHETQKALAELIENEQNGKMHGTINRSSVPSSQINGLVHSQNGGSAHVPPPPPGFVQPTNHMNSFGSKILPYLNMNSSQHQPINGTTTQNNWPASYNPAQQQKGLGNCNDWKVLDPAIVSSSRHFPLANMHMRDQYTSQLQQPQHLQSGLGGGPMRSFDYANFANSPQQQQLQAAASSAFSNFSHLTNSVQQNLNWLAGSAELGTQISSPPGFRTTAAGGPVVGKTQQEC